MALHGRVNRTLLESNRTGEHLETEITARATKDAERFKDLDLLHFLRSIFRKDEKVAHYAIQRI